MTDDLERHWRRLLPRSIDLGGSFVVRRLLPAASQRAVGPFVFFDHFGPVTLAPEAQTDVRPHPHIGLATVTTLFEGAMLHRDSLGTVQEILPGAVNWMNAGRGIVHSERTPAALQGQARPLHGLQLWVALPQALERSEPSFQHVAADDIPECEVEGTRVRVLAGSAYGRTSPVRTASPTLYLTIALRAGMPWTLPPLAAEMAVYALVQSVQVQGEVLSPGEMAVVDAAAGATVVSEVDTQVVVIGGAPLDGPRLLWWNFVATERALIDTAAALWEADGFDPIPGETERIPLPSRP
jgi:redox-sensitive bicupin YhaK (pirin superfamily)